METILILHGWGSCAKNWIKVKELLEARGYKVFAPDLPGFGENPPPVAAWNIDDYVEWVNAFCKKNNLPMIFLMGHSFGGTLAVRLAGRFPDKIKKLILVAPKLRRYRNLKYYIFLIIAKIGHLIFYILPLPPLRSLARKFLYAISGTSDYSKLEIKKAALMKETFKKIVGVNSMPYLSKIELPTLIVWGASDNITPLKDAHLIHRAIKKSRLEIIPDGEHALNLQKPDILAEKILNFIQS